MTAEKLEISNLSDDLKNKIKKFKLDLDAYTATQDLLSSTAEEDRSLDLKASSLERQASETQAAYTRLASSQNVNHVEITAEMERAESLQREAKAIRLIIEKRAILKTPHILKLARMRMQLRSESKNINDEYRIELLNELLSSQTAKTVLIQIFTLSRQIYANDTEAVGIDIKRAGGESLRNSVIESGAWRNIKRATKDIFDKNAADYVIPIVATLPRTVKYEIEAYTPVDLLKLERSHDAA